jgi:hypothetical protein
LLMAASKGGHGNQRAAGGIVGDVLLNVTAHSIDIGFFGTIAIKPDAQSIAHLIKQFLGLGIIHFKASAKTPSGLVMLLLYGFRRPGSVIKMTVFALNTKNSVLRNEVSIDTFFKVLAKTKVIC